MSLLTSLFPLSSFLFPHAEGVDVEAQVLLLTAA
jgi:hypothetical protein